MGLGLIVMSRLHGSGPSRRVVILDSLKVTDRKSTKSLRYIEWGKRREVASTLIWESGETSYLLWG